MECELEVSESANFIAIQLYMYLWMKDLGNFYFRIIIEQFSTCCISIVLFQLMEITVSGQNSCNAVWHAAKEYRHVPEAVLTRPLNMVERTAQDLVHLWKLKSAT